MIKRLISFACLFTLVAILNINCSKDDDPEPTPAKTKTELITTGSWKFDKIEPALADGLITCFKDNTTTFTADGKGNSVDGATACTPPTGSFNWTFMTSETKLHLDAALLPVGSNDFTIETLNETNLVLSQVVTSPIPATVRLTLKH